MTETIGDALRKAVPLLGDSDTARIDAEILLAHALNKPRSHLFAWPEKSLATPEQQHFNDLLEARRRGQPVAYLTGTREFWSLALKVTPGTLIPRPETELLVELAIDRIRERNYSSLLDLGTGSGAIALAIASECPNLRITACDVSPAALAVARENADTLSTSNISWIQSDWFSNIPLETFGIIVSNPPYIEAADSHLQIGDVAHEPKLALSSGRDGLDAIRQIAQQAPEYLCEGGMLMFEHGYTQGNAVREILSSGGFTSLETRQDLSGLDRVSSGMRPTSVARD